ncbi:MAG: hypothetical protein AB7I19_00880 [Planctomycetota bacterium]
MLSTERRRWSASLVALLAAGSLSAQTGSATRPVPQRAHTGALVFDKGVDTGWVRPQCVFDPKIASGRKAAKVVVVVYDPILEAHGNQRLTQWLRSADPVEFSRILVDVIRQSSWGYVNYEIVDVITVDGYTKKVDGFRYDDDSYLEARRTKQWQPATTSYRAVFEENGLIDRFKQEGITELWLWGADGFHFDEFAFHVPRRDERFGPTDNPWLYRPYDIPEELGRTTWVMGFNVEVGADNMVHSYVHRVESIMALAFGDGVWDPKTKRDPWNVFTRLEMDFPGQPSMVGNCHVPPNGERGYDYDNPRSVMSWADHWANYPDLRGEPRRTSSWSWGKNQFGYMRWILDHLPKGPGATKWGYDNWWVYVANTDGDLPDWVPPNSSEFRLPQELTDDPPATRR